ncbi:Endoglucanase 12 [Ancistrocladus abbreviatus]
MLNPNVWGGSFEVHKENWEEEVEQRKNMDWDRAALLQQQQLHGGDHQLDEMQQSWLLAPQEKKKKKKYIDLGCIVCSTKAVKWILGSILIAFLVIALPIIIAKSLPKHKTTPPSPDNYTLALHKALLFFNAQKSGRLPENNGIPWRGNSGLNDGSNLTDVKGGLVGGYYDSGENTKYHFPMAFAMTMLSWSVIEYPHKYHAINEYDHVRDLIKWGTNYLLKTFNNTATKIDKIYSQVGGALNNSNTPNDYTCWERPEDMDYPRPIQTAYAGPDLAGEMAAAFAAASIVFQDDDAYSKKLIKGAQTVFSFARDGGKRTRYSSGNPWIAPYYNSTGYYDEYMWGATWLYYATGNTTYSSLATNPGIPRNARAFRMNANTSVMSWNNKLPGAMLLLTRFRMFLNPGYPYETTLMQYHNVTCLNMCSYLKQFQVFNWTHGGLIQLNQGGPQPLQYVVNAAFLANLFADYMNASVVPGFNCGPYYVSAPTLRSFALSQIDYILGKNPLDLSYVVGYGSKYPKRVHHRAASIPKNGVRYSCTSGYRWRDSTQPNPNTIEGAMVGGPDRTDHFKDNRKLPGYTEPTMAGNAGLVAALVSLTGSGGYGVERNYIFSGVPPLYPQSPPPPPPWKP